MIKIGFQGDNYSNNYYAAKKYANEHNVTYEGIPLINSYPVLEALVNNKIDYGVVAYRNSIAGLVKETQDALTLLGKYVQVVEEIVLPIHHCLFTSKDTIGDIKHIYSHEQALYQCDEYIKAHYKDANIISERDTSLAALKLVSGDYKPDSAVICNKGCGEYYKLRLIAENIETDKSNHTIFKVYKTK